MSNTFSTSGDKGTSPVNKGWIIPIVIIIAVLIVVFNSFSVVNEGFIGVKYQFGKIVRSDLTAGLRFKIPFIEKIEQVDIRHQVYEFTGDAFTKDTQRITDLRLKLTYQFDAGQVSNIIKNTGVLNVESKFLIPNVQTFAKDAFGRVNAELLVQNRESVQSEIQESLTAALAQHGIVVVGFAIENISFSETFENSIQAKVVAEQEALQMKNKTEERREEAEQIRIKAQADADAVTIKAEADAEAIALIQAQIAQNQEYIEYLKIINWNGILPQVIGDGVNPFIAISGGTNPITEAAQ